MSEFDELYEMIAGGASKENVADLFGMGTVYIPSVRTLRCDVARQHAPAEYDGTNALPLARKYRVTVAFIRKIVRALPGEDETG